jgi:hypothetical protein
MRERGPGFPLRSDPGYGDRFLFTANESSEAPGRRSIRYVRVKPTRNAMYRSETSLRFCSRERIE